MIEVDLDFVFFSVGIFLSLPLFWMVLAQKGKKEPEGSTSTVKLVSTMIVLGSGGHTTEILRLASILHKDVYRPRTYVIADTDARSEEKLRLSLQDEEPTILRLPRAREVGQSWISSALSTSKACLSAVGLVFRNRPNLLLVNGPGTCIPLCLSAWFFNKVLIMSKYRSKIVYIESICRVTTLSLSAKILMHFADEILVQWPELAKNNPKTKYIARFT